MHKQYKRIAEDPVKAVLFIHGIVGTPNHFNMLLPLVPQHLSVYNMLLDGHGKGVREFAKSSMEKWRRQVADAVAELSECHQQIYIVAHSMGCLLALEQAVCNSKVKGLFLLAVPLKLFLKPQMFMNAFKVRSGRFGPDDEVLVAAKACYGITDDETLLHYLGWLPRYLELFFQIRKTRKMIHRVQTPTVAYQSGRDEMVCRKAGKLLSENPNIKVVELKNSSHYYYEKNDLARLKEAFIDYCSD